MRIAKAAERGLASGLASVGAGRWKLVRPRSTGSGDVGCRSASRVGRYDSEASKSGRLVLPSSTGRLPAGLSVALVTTRGIVEASKPKGERVRPSNTGSGPAGLPSGGVMFSTAPWSLEAGVDAVGDVARAFGVIPPVKGEGTDDRMMAGSAGSTDGAARERNLSKDVIV